MADSIRFIGIVLMTLSMTMLGCSRQTPVPPPKVYSAKGKVTYLNGQPVANGTIEFRSKSNPTLTMMSTIATDGSLELFTIHANERLPGAVPGPCTVTVHPPPKDLARPVEPYRVPDVLTVEPKDNTYKIVIGSGFKSQ